MAADCACACRSIVGERFHDSGAHENIIPGISDFGLYRVHSAVYESFRNKHIHPVNGDGKWDNFLSHVTIGAVHRDAEVVVSCDATWWLEVVHINTVVIVRQRGRFNFHGETCKWKTHQAVGGQLIARTRCRYVGIVTMAADNRKTTKGSREPKAMSTGIVQVLRKTRVLQASQIIVQRTRRRFPLCAAFPNVDIGSWQLLSGGVISPSSICIVLVVKRQCLMSRRV